MAKYEYLGCFQGSKGSDGDDEGDLFGPLLMTVEVRATRGLPARVRVEQRILLVFSVRMWQLASPKTRRPSFTTPPLVHDIQMHV